ncbi:hypothetical protein [Natronolimnobius sp. AArcel1]|nr:hypothetical protein [Natronolimnobius sp. AArcel1]
MSRCHCATAARVAVAPELGTVPVCERPKHEEPNPSSGYDE